MAKKPRRQPAPPAAQKQAGPNRLYMMLAAAALVVVALVAFLTMGGSDAATAPVRTVEPGDGEQARGVSIGAEDAPVVLYEFADYQCPACASFATFNHPLIKERLVDRGIVRMVRYDFPLVMSHPNAFLASRAARCAGDQGRYWEYHDILYARQPTWSPMRNPLNSFIDMAGDAGLSTREFRDCLRSDRHAEEVTRNMRLGESLSVRGTPTIFVNGEIATARDYRELEAWILDRAGMAGAPETDAD